MTARLSPESAPVRMDAAATTAAAPGPPRYLELLHPWARVRPIALRLFERDRLVHALPFGHYDRLRDGALDAIGASVCGHTLQMACAHGNLTQCLQQRLARDARLDVVDVLPVHRQHPTAKWMADERVCLIHGDPAALACADASYDQVLLFFLLHEQPASLRCATLSEAMRVVKPGGKVIIVDYHPPSRWHPTRALMRLLFRRLQPCALDLWRHEVIDSIPVHAWPALLTKRTYFGGLYQKLVLVR